MPQIWLSKLVSDLHKYAEISNVQVQNNSLHIKYKNGTRDHFWLNPFKKSPSSQYTFLDRAGSGSTKYITVEKAKSNGLSGTDDQHVLLNKRLFYSATTIDRAFAVQKFVKALQEMEFHTKVTQEMLQADQDRLLRYDYTKCYADKSITFAYTKSTRPGSITLEHYVDFGINVAADPHILFRTIKYFETRRRLISSRGVFGRIRQKCGPPIGFARAYEALFRRIGVNGTLYDAHPSTGVKALTCGLMGMKYVTDPCPVFDAAKKCGLLSMTGTEHAYRGDVVADWGIVDWNCHLASFAYRDALKYAKFCKRLLVYVPFRHVAEAMAFCRPEASFAVTVNFHTGPSYYFVW